MRPASLRVCYGGSMATDDRDEVTTSKNHSEAGTPREAEVADRIEADTARLQPSRRAFIGGAAAAVAAGTLLTPEEVFAAGAPATPNLAASPPAGFTPFSAPGRVI